MAHLWNAGTASMAIAAEASGPHLDAPAPDAAAAVDAEVPDNDILNTEVNEDVLTPQSARVDAFYGNIDPFYGDIDAFGDDISPFYGAIGAFYGTINPFWDDISPFSGNIGAFWGDMDAFYGNIGAFEEGYLASIGTYWTHTAALFRETEKNWAAFAANPSDIAAGMALSGSFDSLIA